LQPREHLPGELAGRFERLMGASVWLVMPLLLVFTTPVLVEALRYAFRSAPWSLTLLGLFALVTVLVVEQWALRWSLLPRSAATEERLAALLWFTLSALLLVAMMGWADQLWQSGRRDEAVFALIVAAPLFWLPLGRLSAFRPLAGEIAPREVPSIPGERFAAVGLGRLVALQLRGASWRGTLLKAAIVLATGVAAAVMAGSKGKALSMLLALAMAPVGAAVATLMITLFAPAWVIHLRSGHFRVAASRAGMAFQDTGWRRRLVLPLALQRRLGANPRAEDAAQRRALRPDEKDWMVQVSRRQTTSRPEREDAGGAA